MFIFSFRNIKKEADNYFSVKRNTDLGDFSYNLLLFLMSTIPFLWGGLFFSSFLILLFLFDLYEVWGDIVFIITASPILVLSLLDIIIQAVNYFSSIKKRNIGNITFNIILFLFWRIIYLYFMICGIILILMTKSNINIF